MAVAYFAHIVFTIVFICIGLLFLWWSVRQIKSTIQETSDKQVAVGFWIWLAIKLICIWGLFIILFNLSWNVKQNLIQQSRPRLVNPDEQQAIEDAQNHVPMSDQEILDQRGKLNQPRKDDHDEALEDFDKRMRDEADKIRKRNQPKEE